MVIAPASANTLSKMANGACDNLLIASYLSAKCPVFFAPAMDLDMYQHPSTKENISKLLSYGNRMIAPTDGELASGLFGEGRMEEAEKIVQVLSDFFLNAQPLKKALVSAGPTSEAIDPVRFIGNRSSGKMGYAIAEELSRQGAEVVLVSGPTALSHPLGVKVVKVESAAEMKAACMDNYAKMDVVVMAAAVADFKPAQSAEQKIKKKNSELDLSLVPTEDILKAMGEKKTTQFLVGFALESENELSNAKDKLSRKNLDMIVMNSIRDNGAGFNHDTNQITVINSKGQEKTFPLKSKKDVAKDLIEIIVSSLKK
jgi:phosphopantothenoylcysteine decarboxylase/phosphopantothenate--cysteine ligase